MRNGGSVTNHLDEYIGLIEVEHLWYTARG